MRAIITFLLCASLFAACSKTEDSQPMAPISDIPSIEIEKISPMAIDQFESLNFEISYIDGDGDIGSEDADDHALEITDNRAAIVHTFHIPPQSPSSGITISGVFVVELKNLILLDQAAESEKATFNIRLKDRAGNWSKTRTTEEITISG